MHPSHTYQCSVAARTEAGVGPYADKILDMPEAGMPIACVNFACNKVTRLPQCNITNIQRIWLALLATLLFGCDFGLLTCA